jgi:hypothetical protein
MDAKASAPLCPWSRPVVRSASACAEHRRSPVIDGDLLALAMSQRGLRRPDVLRRSEDRAPPSSH